MARHDPYPGSRRIDPIGLVFAAALLVTIGTAMNAAPSFARGFDLQRSGIPVALVVVAWSGFAIAYRYSSRVGKATFDRAVSCLRPDHSDWFYQRGLAIDRHAGKLVVASPEQIVVSDLRQLSGVLYIPQVSRRSVSGTGDAVGAAIALANAAAGAIANDGKSPPRPTDSCLLMRFADGSEIKLLHLGNVAGRRWADLLQAEVRANHIAAAAPFIVTSR